MNAVNLQLKKTEKSTEKQIKSISQYKTQAIETQAKKLLSSVFSKNQLDLIMKKKNVLIGLEKRYQKYLLSGILVSVHVYIKNDLNYPLLHVG